MEQFGNFPLLKIKPQLVYTTLYCLVNSVIKMKQVNTGFELDSSSPFLGCLRNIMAIILRNIGNASDCNTEC